MRPPLLIKAAHFCAATSCKNISGPLLRRFSSTPRAAATTATTTTTARSSRYDRPFRMAVVGSGPAGFYTAYRVMSKMPGSKVDMYEALPVPFGLVRFGVAPDHPEVKNCQDKFDEVASSPDFTFVGNVSVGQPSAHAAGGSVPLPSLLRNYDAVVFAYGAAEDKRLGVPGEDLEGVYSARQFVGWYNGLPEHAALAPDLSRGEEAVVVGQGNVALDVARMLLEDVDVLRRTDIAEHALEALSRNRVKRVHVVGRRGPMQAAFTIKEARELMKLRDVGFHPVDPSLIPSDIKKLPRTSRRLMELLAKGSANPLDSSTKSWALDFCLAPHSFKPRSDDPSTIGSTVFNRTVLSSPFDREAHVKETAAQEEGVEIPSSVAFRSIGYRAAPLPEFADLGIEFNTHRGWLHNDGLGRVLRGLMDPNAAPPGGGREQVPGLYCAGWVKRGATGVIASTMDDAFATADAIAQDWRSPSVPFLHDGDGGEAGPGGWDAVAAETTASSSSRGAKVVGWDDWRRIDRAERERGSRKGVERVKFPTTEEMLSVVS